MPTPRSIEAKLDRLAALRLAPSAPETREALRKALSSKESLLVAKAVKLIAEFKRTDFAPELAAAFQRVIAAPANDPGCAASTSIAQTLLDSDDPSADEAARAVFAMGVRHVQLEGTWGGHKDAAAELRATCAMGLAKIGDRDALVALTDLLADPEAAARVGAARALGFTGQEAAGLVLRFKLTQRDPHPDVTAECLVAVLRLRPRWAVPFVGSFLADRDPAVRAGAALALGESRAAGAFDLLRDRYAAETNLDVRKPLALALAMLRSEEGQNILLEQVRRGPVNRATDAIEALAIYKHDATVRARVDAAVKERKDEAIGRAVGKAFGC